MEITSWMMKKKAMELLNRRLRKVLGYAASSTVVFFGKSFGKNLVFQSESAACYFA